MSGTIPNSAPPSISPADAEALELIARIADRVAVARSFARIATGALQVRAVRASELLRVYREVAPRELRRVAEAAVAAAAHVARTELAHAGPLPPKADRPEDEDALARQGDEEEEEEPSSLDYEALHDDAC